MIMPPNGYDIDMMIKVICITIAPYAVLTLRALKVYRHEGTQVALGVLVRIEVAGETANGQIVNRSNVLLISWILTLAGHPDCVELN